MTSRSNKAARQGPAMRSNVRSALGVKSGVKTEPVNQSNMAQVLPRPADDPIAGVRKLANQKPAGG